MSKRFEGKKRTSLSCKFEGYRLPKKGKKIEEYFGIYDTNTLNIIVIFLHNELLVI